ncbi:hypothetical protein MESS2_1370076 [Mesorhizobium metallidurans STM 2683]|uniref:Uncharacterized protein n=1 Tax=Mesorhizobium metallidurans STM 2683 TaxID=1297569 RepID=M5EJ98_9HYPH|nr:hypothetical protein MESS2_1370076 [Mesorhizobium metallidurans STM 2683]
MAMPTAKRRAELLSQRERSLSTPLPEKRTNAGTDGNAHADAGRYVFHCDTKGGPETDPDRHADGHVRILILQGSSPRDAVNASSGAGRSGPRHFNVRRTRRMPARRWR